MKKLFLLLLISHTSAFSQGVYSATEVDQQAVPHVGLLEFNKFIAANFQIPFRAQLLQLQGRVFCSGVAELDGTLSEVKVIRGLHPIYDQEIVRIVNLFKSWKPALRNGQKVRQQVTFPVVINTTSSPPMYDSTLQVVYKYYNKNYEAVNDSTLFHYRRVIPIDSNGLARADIQFEELRRGKWKSILTIPFKKETIWYKAHENSKDSIQATRVSAQDQDWNHYIPVIVRSLDGKLLSYTQYGDNMKVIYSKKYHTNGLLQMLNDASGDQISIVSWYDNGQLFEIIKKTPPSPQQASRSTVWELWSKKGVQYIKGGEGWGYYDTNTFQNQPIIEQGQFQKGEKVGKWIGKLASDTTIVCYEEFYQNGTLKEGTALIGDKKISYSEVEKYPEFEGGIPALGNFLAENIIYPTSALRKGINGKVYISFVVCEDGSLCDYQIIKGIGGGCDEEALRVVKAMSGKWISAKVRGQKVRFKYNIPISFRLR